VLFEVLDLHSMLFVPGTFSGFVGQGEILPDRQSAREWVGFPQGQVLVFHFGQLLMNLVSQPSSVYQELCLRRALKFRDQRLQLL
jgi:hypothetical protein